MKKFLFLTLILSAIISTSVNAQGGTAQAQGTSDPAAILQQMKEKQKPGLVEKVGLTDAQAEKVIEINYEMRMQAARELKDLNEADRTKKLTELKSAKEKKFLEFLTPEQIKTMNTYYEEMGKNRQQKSGN